MPNEIKLKGAIAEHFFFLTSVMHSHCRRIMRNLIPQKPKDQFSPIMRKMC